MENFMEQLHGVPMEYDIWAGLSTSETSKGIDAMNLENAAGRLGGICPAGMGSFSPLPEAEIGEIEKQIEASLPTQYRLVLEKYGAFSFNGRSADNPYVYFQSTEPLPEYITSKRHIAVFDFFYGAAQQAGPSGLLQQIALFKDRIPGTMIPIAGDGGAGQICLGIKGDDLGKVFYWDLANEPLDEETYLEDFGKPMPADAKRQNVHLVADSFDQFLDQLLIGPET
jgi:hypothetical protein